MLELIGMASDLVDLFDVTVGSWPEDSGTSRYYPEGHERPWTHRVREATGCPGRRCLVLRAVTRRDSCLRRQLGIGWHNAVGPPTMSFRR